MFGVGWAEILLVMIVAVLVVPAKDWPKLFYQAGRWVRIARNIVDDAKRDFEKALYTDDMRDLHNDLKKISFDPLPPKPQPPKADTDP